MRAAHMKERPGFSLMKQTDIQNLYYMQMPRWLFSDPRYAEMGLDVKVTYTFLLNRFQLSRRKGWVNEEGEVFVIFPRKALAQELRICEKRVIAAFRTLAEKQLIWENAAGAGTPIKSSLLQRCINLLLSDITGAEITRICVAYLNHMGRLLIYLFTEKKYFSSQ